MFTRTMSASVLPRRRRPRPGRPDWRAIARRLNAARYRSLAIQERMEADRIRYAKRQGSWMR